MFLAVGANARFYGTNGFAARSSDDGLTWQEFRLAKPLSGVFFGGGVFIAIASDGTIHRSLNGETWIEQAAITSRALTCWAYGSGTFVLGGTLGTIFSSTDAVEWIPRSSGPYDSLSGVAFGQGLFVAVGGKPNAAEAETPIDSAVIRTSPDGIAWTTLNPGYTRWLSDVSYGSDQFIAVGKSGTILTSADGIEWEGRDSGTTNDLSGIAHGMGTYVAVGGFDESHVILSSIDGITWIQRASGSNVLSSVAFGNGKFVAAGVFYDDRGDYHTYLLNSPDGIQWQQVGGDFRFRINAIAFGSGRFVAVGSFFLSGSNARTIVSTDGVSWTQSNAGGPALYGVGFGNETFVSVGQYSYVRSSINGLNWDARLFDSRRNLSGVAYGNGTFVVVGSQGTILQSANVAIPWLTLLQRPGGLTLTLEGEIGRVYRIEASTDLIGWSDIGSVTNSRMGTDFLDSTASDSRQRFYRAVFP